MNSSISIDGATSYTSTNSSSAQYVYGPVPEEIDYSNPEGYETSSTAMTYIGLGADFLLEQINIVKDDLAENISWDEYLVVSNSKFSSVQSLFPLCLYDSTAAQRQFNDNGTGNDEYKTFLEAMVYLGIEENPNLTYSQYMENLENGKYILKMSEYMGGSFSDINNFNIESTIELISGRTVFRESEYSEMTLYDSVVNEIYGDPKKISGELISEIEEEIWNSLGEFNNEYKKAICYLIGTGVYDVESFKSELQEAKDNGTEKEFFERKYNEAYRKVLNQYIDYDKLEVELYQALIDCSTGKITEEEYRRLLVEKVYDSMREYSENAEEHPYALSVYTDSSAGYVEDEYTLIVNYDKLMGVDSPIEVISKDKLTEDFSNSFNDYVLCGLDFVQTKQKEDIKYLYEVMIYQIQSESDFEKYSVKPTDFPDDYDDYIEVMTQAEIDALYYFYNKYGEDETVAFIEAKEDDFNSRIGLIDAYNWLNENLMIDGEFKSLDELTEEQLAELEQSPEFKELGLDENWHNLKEVINKGISDGIEIFCEGIWNTVGGADGKVSAAEYERMYIQMLLAESSLLSKGYSISSAIGNMAIPMAISTVASIATMNPGTAAGIMSMFGPLLSSAAFSVSIYGNAYEGALQQGYSPEQASCYAALSALSEGTTQLVLGGIPGLSILNKGGYLFECLSEAGEETLQYVLDAGFRQFCFGEEIQLNYDELLQSGFDGFLVAAILNAPTSTIDGYYEVYGMMIDPNKLNQESYIDQLREQYAQHNFESYPELMQKVGDSSVAFKLINAEYCGVAIDYDKLSDPNYVSALCLINSKQSANVYNDIVASGQTGILNNPDALSTVINADNLGIMTDYSKLSDPNYINGLKTINTEEKANAYISFQAEVLSSGIEIDDAAMFDFVNNCTLSIESYRCYTDMYIDYKYGTDVLDAYTAIKDGNRDAIIEKTRTLTSESLAVLEGILNGSQLEMYNKAKANFTLNVDNVKNTLLSGDSVAIETALKNTSGTVVSEAVSMLDENQRGNLFDTLKNGGLLNGKWAPNRELFVKYADVFTNPEYCDINTGGVKWPQAEGAVEFVGMTDAELLSLGMTSGVEGLKSKGATEVSFEELSGNSLARVTTAPTMDADTGQYFGNTSDSKKSRCLQPYTTENGKVYTYKFTGKDGTGETIMVNGNPMTIGVDCKIVPLKTHAADFYNQKGGAEQIMFYLVDNDGKIIKRNNENNLYKLGVDELRQVGILEDGEEITLN